MSTGADPRGGPGIPIMGPRTWQTETAWGQRRTIRRPGTRWRIVLPDSADALRFGLAGKLVRFRLIRLGAMVEGPHGQRLLMGPRSVGLERHDGRWFIPWDRWDQTIAALPPRESG